MTRAQFDQAKDRALTDLDIFAVARWLGLEVKGDRAPCPFHSERSIGAFQFNPKECYCHCHSCGANADAIGLTAYIKGIRPAEALRQLNTAFNLGLCLDNTTALEDKKAREQYEKLKAKKHYIKTVKETLKNILQELEEGAHTLYPHDCDSVWDARYTFALNERETAEAYLTALNDDVIPTDAHLQVKAWLQAMHKLDPRLEERQRIKAEISDVFQEFIEGRIEFAAIIKKHKNMVTKLKNSTR